MEVILWNIFIVQEHIDILLWRRPISHTGTCIGHFVGPHLGELTSANPEWGPLYIALHGDAVGSDSPGSLADAMIKPKDP
jgi:hypothetical protein